MKCPYFGSLNKCLIFYRPKISFRIPCRALHPDIKVTEQTTNPYKFKYNPEVGFYAQLTNDLKEFECRAFYDQHVDVQRYELNRKSFSTKILIVPNRDIEFIPAGPSVYNLIVPKGKPLNLTCLAVVGCNDINYDIKFITNLEVSNFFQHNLFVKKTNNIINF